VMPCSANHTAARSRNPAQVAFLIGETFGVGQSGMVVDGGGVFVAAGGVPGHAQLEARWVTGLPAATRWTRIRRPYRVRRALARPYP
jgi:hypothetical protein